MGNEHTAKLNIVFMGSSDFSLTSLKRLYQKYFIRGVVTQPDRPAGRKRQLVSSPVRIFAEDSGLEIFQPENLRDAQSVMRLKKWQSDLVIVVAYGQILNQEVLDIPKYGCINVHASLLPRWRGASPIQSAILNGDDITGVTIMKLDSGIDTGPILANREEMIKPSDTTRTLGNRLAEIGADLLIEILPKYINGQIIPQPQDNLNATYTGKFTKEDGELDFSQPAEYLARKVAAFNPWPGAFMVCENNFIKIHKAHVVKETTASIGKREVLEKKPAIGTSNGWLVLDEVQPESRKPMSGQAFLAGARYWHGK